MPNEKAPTIWVGIWVAIGYNPVLRSSMPRYHAASYLTLIPCRVCCENLAGTARAFLVIDGLLKRNIYLRSGARPGLCPFTRQYSLSGTHIIAKWSSHSISYGDRLGGLNGAGPNRDHPPLWLSGRTPSPMITIRGSGFDVQKKYQCQFTVPDGESPLPTSWDSLSCSDGVCTSPGLVLSNDLLFCTPPDLNTDMTWTEFPSSVLTVLDVQEYCFACGDIFASVSTQLNATEKEFRFVQINKRPFFVGASVMYPSESVDQNVMLQHWASDIWEGVFEDGTRVDVERSQNVSFRVSCDTCPDSMQLTVHANGTLAFRNRHLLPGIYWFSVRLEDDGGTAFQGVDTSFESVHYLEVTREQATFKELLPDPVFHEFVLHESADLLKLYVFQSFIRDDMEQLSLYTDSAIQSPFIGDFDVESRVLEDVDLSYDTAYFSSDFPPTVTEDGVISLKVKPHVHGNTSLMLQKREFFKLANKSVVSSLNFTVVIQSLNSPPSFVINSTHPGLRRMEDECNQGCSIPGFAFNILKGPATDSFANVPTSAADDQSWLENHQNVTFLLHGDRQSFLRLLDG